MKENYEALKLTAQQLKRTVNPAEFDFETTAELPNLKGIVGQKRGHSVINFGLHVDKVGYNIYIAGLPGTGKNTFANSLVREFAEDEVELFDWCYVYNFDDAYKPKVLKLPVGFGKKLKQDMEDFVNNLKTDIPRAFNEESYKEEKKEILQDLQDKTNEIFQELNAIAAESGFVIRQSGSGFLTIPLVNGKPITEEEYQELDEEVVLEIEERTIEIQDKVLEFTNTIRDLEKEAKKTLENLDNRVALAAAGYHLDDLKEKYQDCHNILTYLAEVQDDILVNIGDFLQREEAETANPLQGMLQRAPKNSNFPMKYEVNLIVDNTETKGAPVVTADNPTFYNVVGKVEYESRMGVMSTNFTKIKPGFLHKANGGYLIIQAKDILTKSYSWDALKRALLTRKVQIENIGEHAGLMATTSLNPEAIPLDIKVIIIGNLELYQLLYHHDEDFGKLFKIKADFDVEMDYNKENMNLLASFIHTHCNEHDLLHFDRAAVAKVVEHSIRLTSHQEKMSTRFNRLVEIIYEADTWAKMAGAKLIEEEHIKKAIREREYRSSLYEEKIQESIDEGSILLDTDGLKVGQLNGLAVYNVGQYSFGKPARITATTFMGRSGIVNIERESKMSGKIHNKGVYILTGYLGEQFAQDNPLSLTAHLAFEQSYGGIDGDSASSTELYALLSSLSEVPLKQGIAVTGSVNQKGEIQPIGGVNEKIEGFFDVCKNKGLTGEQGVMIPHQNEKNLMLKDKVIEAVEAGMFHIYTVKTIEEGIEILTGEVAGKKKSDGTYEEGSVFAKVAAKLNQYVEKSNPEASKKIEK
ncbi:MAG TPA: ATP-binding protein [Pseudogracilibacillus sp.]|nr:ATP-binding protein [Pseudogracilibacillus sp.]